VMISFGSVRNCSPSLSEESSARFNAIGLFISCKRGGQSATSIVLPIRCEARSVLTFKMLAAGDSAGGENRGAAREFEGG
jgi:hypothetical protein